jgi:hypothetical protein
VKSEYSSYETILHETTIHAASVIRPSLIPKNDPSHGELGGSYGDTHGGKINGHTWADEQADRLRFEVHRMGSHRMQSKSYELHAMPKQLRIPLD